METIRVHQGKAADISSITYAAVSSQGRRHDPAANRLRIIEAATNLFEQRGFRETGVDAVAADARVSKRTIYECFPDKHAILEAVLTDFANRQFRQIARDSEEAPCLREKIFAIVEGAERAARDSHSVAMVRLQIAEAAYMPGLAARMSAQGQKNAVGLLRPLLSQLGIGDVDGAAAWIYDLFVLAPLHRKLTETPAHSWDARQRIDLLLAGIGAVFPNDASSR